VFIIHSARNLHNLCVWLTGLCWISSVHCQTILVLSEFDKYIYRYACLLFSVPLLLINYNCIKFFSNMSPTICIVIFIVDMQLSFFRNIWRWFLQGVFVQLTVKSSEFRNRYRTCCLKWCLKYIKCLQSSCGSVNVDNVAGCILKSLILVRVEHFTINLIFVTV